MILTALLILISAFLTYSYLKQRKKYQQLLTLVKRVLTPGDLADRTAIAMVRDVKLHSWQTSDQKNDHRALLMDLYPEMWGYALQKLRMDLVANHMKQWESEDRVRMEKSAEAALEARECNNKRTELKNHINKIFEAEIEIKRYKGEK